MDRRQLDALTLPGRMLSFDKARQAMRIIRERTELQRRHLAVAMAAEHVDGRHRIRSLIGDDKLMMVTRCRSTSW